VGVIGIDPEYFWHKMSSEEMIAVHKSREMVDQISWEQTRIISYWSIVAMHGNEKYKNPKDLFKLPWEIKKDGR
jgi:hypothetical protein